MCLTETCSRVRAVTHLSGTFPIMNDLKQDVLSPFLFKFALWYAIVRVQVNQDGLKLNGTYYLLVYTDDVNILGGSVHVMKKNTDALVVAIKEISVEVNADKTKYMFMSRDQDAGRSHSINIDNNSFEMMEEFVCLGTTLTNQNYIQEEIKSRMKSGNACYHLVQNILSSSLLSKTIKTKIYRSYNFACCFVWV